MIYNVDLKAVNNLSISNDNLSIYFIDYYDRIVTIRQDRTFRNHAIVQDNIYIQGSDESVTITADR